MTPRKAKLRPPQPVARQTSDYESDLNAAAVLAALPLPPARTEAELNLSVLRQHEPLTTSILFIAPYAVVYTFSPATEQWEKCRIEGTLFVCQLTPRPAGGERYSVIILNRRGLNNFQLELRKADQVEETDEYIILQDDDDEEGTVGVFGLWIFSEPEPSSTARSREQAARVIADCAARAETTRVAASDSGRVRSQHAPGPIEITLSDPHLPTFPSPAQPEGGDILGDLFRKAGLNYRRL